MKRLLCTTTILALSTMLVLGIYAPTSAPMLLAATSEDYIFIRLALILMLASLLLYSPPRALGFRIGLAGMAIILGASTMMLLSTYNLQLFDALIFFETTILLLLEAAELGVEKKKIPVRRHIEVKSAPRKIKLQTI